ncbi:MAG TPA: type II toxin-antitoxin system VapC family toxin [Solirubrobacterales bacterium]|nr:type II toxin-antitoxin system VapC family toxin [Solirubrobacterales bacterium]
MIVVDASVLAPALADDGADGDRVRLRLRGEQLVAPELVDLEVLSTLRRAVRAGRLDERRSGQALDDLAALPLRRVPHLPLLTRAWELRDNLTAYDAAYVALAESLRALLLTADGGIEKAIGVRCDVEVLA